MPVIFQDDFEVGTTPWYTQTLINGTITFVTGGTLGMPTLGNSCIKCDTTAALDAQNRPAECRAIMMAHILSSTDVYVSAKIAVTQGMSLQPYDRIYFLTLYDSVGNIVVRFGLRNDGVSNWWSMWSQGRLLAGLDPSMYGNAVVPTTEVLRLVLHHRASDGLCEAYLNDQLMLADTHPDPSAITRVDVGINKPGASGVSYDPTGAYPVQAYFDDVIIASEYPGGGVVQPKITIQSNPELNVPVYVDDVFMGNTPIQVQVPSGQHTVRVEPEVTR